MAGGKTTIRELLEVRPHPTVVRLADLEAESAHWLSDTFLVTPEIRTHLCALQRLLERDEGGGAFLIGHYGSGKSHFLAYLIQQLNAGKLVSRPLRVVSLSLVNFAAGNRLEEIVSGALGVQAGTGDRRLAWERLGSREEGTLLILDELSEFLRSKEDARAFNEDVRFLQFLGEWSRDHRFWIVAAMQEGIEHTGELEHSLYRKIKDRYPLRLLLTPAHVQSLIADAILIKKEGYGAAVRRLGQELQRSQPGISLDMARLQAIYPLHPVTLALLEEIRDRFSQTRGVVDFVVTTLRGDDSREVKPFLDQPWGALITPDYIVDHFRDLFELQPEFIPLAQQLFPWYREQLERLFEKSALRLLAERLLKLLVLVHLSPVRERLTAREAAAWLLFGASRVDPERNLRIVRKVLDRFADEGRFVVREEGGYRLELRDDGGAAFEMQLEREMAALRGQPELVLEMLVPLLPADGFNPFTLPRDRYQHRRLSWRFHERSYAVWFGEKEPLPLDGEAGELRICVRLPWGDAAPAVGCHTLIPAPLRVEEDLLELAALTRLREHPLGMEQKPRLERRIAERLPAWRSALQNAWLQASLVTPEGKREQPPRFDLAGKGNEWLEALALWVLRRTYPAFERFAPTHGPLPREAWRRFMAFVTEADLLGEQADEHVMLIREAYLVPMGLLRRRGREYAIPGNLERHELVALVTPLLEHSPSPRTIAEHLGNPIYGLVGDQVRALLTFLLLQGVLDIVRHGSSYRDSFETLPDPLQYEQVVPGSTLDAEQLQAVEQLCAILGLPVPRQWNVLAQRRLARRIREAAKKRVEGLRPLAERLQSHPEGEPVARRLALHLEKWQILTAPGDPLQALRQLFYEVDPVAAWLAEAETFDALGQRLERLLAEVERYRHLLRHPALSEGAWAERVAALGAMPALDRPDDLEGWLEQVGALYARYREEYRAAHERWWHSVAAHPLWTWQSPAVARSRHLGLETQLAALESCRDEAQALRCRGLVNLDFQPVCSCGFDGEGSPVSGPLRRFEALRREVEERLQHFFRQERVRRRLLEWREQGLDSPGVAAYLEGSRPVPEVEDLALLDEQLAGLEPVREVEDSLLLEPLTGRAWEPEELLGRLKRQLDELGGKRIRIRRTPPDGSVPEPVAEWCGEQAVRFGVPLPKGLDRGALRRITEQLSPEKVGDAALLHLDRLGLDSAGRERILSWLLEGAIPLPEKPAERGSVLEAVQIFCRGTVPATPEELAVTAVALYRHATTLRRVVGEGWISRLDELTTPRLSGIPPLPEALRSHAAAQWVLIDALGLVLLEPLRPVIGELFSAWRAPRISFARVAPDTTTDGCYRQLLQAGVKHPLEKLDVVDQQIHAASADFDELVSRVGVELRIAARRLLTRLDPGLPLLLFADHGFRLDPAGRGYRHGGDSPLERLVPLWFLAPHGREG